MTTKPIGYIVAHDLNGVIGDGESLPAWNLMDDRKYFKNTTFGHIVIMGRKNWESIPEKYRPLSGRVNIVMTRDRSWKPNHPDVLVAHSLSHALKLAEQAVGEKIFIIGGGEIYRLAMEELSFDEVHITEVKGVFAGTVTIPRFNADDFICPEAHDFFKDEKGRNSHDFTIKKYVRKTPY